MLAKPHGLEKATTINVTSSLTLPLAVTPVIVTGYEFSRAGFDVCTLNMIKGENAVY